MKLLTRNETLNLYKSKYYGNIVIDSHKNWFPIRSSPQLSGVVADLICDGHLQGSNKWRMDYTSKNKKELNRFNNQIYQLFGIKSKIRFNHGNKFGRTFNLGVNNKLLGRIMNQLGVPYGAKVLKEFLIPEWILEDKEYFRNFARRAFTCEGTVDTSSKNSFVRIEMWKSIELINNSEEFFTQIKRGLKSYFDIESTNVFAGSYQKRKDGTITRGTRLYIKRLDSLIRFYKEIGFEDPLKQNKLKVIINKRIMGQSRTGQ